MTKLLLQESIIVGFQVAGDSQAHKHINKYEIPEKWMYHCSD